MRFIRQIHLFGALGALTLATACVEPGAPDGVVPVRVTMQRTGSGATAQAANGLLASVVAAQGVIDPGNVEAFTAQLDAVEGHTPGSGWTTVDLSAAPPALDLLALPLLGDPAIVLGMVEVEPGECRVRLTISDLSIDLVDDVIVGKTTYPSDVPITADLKIPSGELKATGLCELDGGTGDLTLVFDDGSTLGTIVATGNGTIIVTPVIHVETL